MLIFTNEVKAGSGRGSESAAAAGPFRGPRPHLHRSGYQRNTGGIIDAGDPEKVPESAPPTPPIYDGKMRNTFRILFYPKRSAALRNGQVPIICRITIDKQRVQLPTRMHVAPERWSRARGCVAGRSEEAELVNQTLARLRYRIEKCYHMLGYSHPAVTARMLKKQLLGQSVRQERLLAFFARHNAEFLRTVGISRSMSTYYKYESVRKLLSRYVHERRRREDIDFSDVDRNFLIGFHAYVLEDDRRSKNTACVYLVALKHILHLARASGCAVGDPFSGYPVRGETVRRGYLTLEEVRRLSRITVPDGTHRLIRDAFLFSCFTGLSYVDLKRLRFEDVRRVGGEYWLSTHRQKTGTAVDIPLFELPLSIFLHYASARESDSLFPLPCNSWCNDRLRELMLRADVCRPVTFHMARHTFATSVTLSQGVAIETISKMLGHKNIRTTQIYATLTHARISDEMKRLHGRLQRLCPGWSRPVEPFFLIPDTRQAAASCPQIPIGKGRIRG